MEEAEGDQWTSRDVWALTTPVDFHHTLLCHSSFRIFKNRVGTWSLLEGGIITALLFAVFLTDDEGEAAGWHRQPPAHSAMPPLCSFVTAFVEQRRAPTTTLMVEYVSNIENVSHFDH